MHAPGRIGLAFALGFALMLFAAPTMARPIPEGTRAGSSLLAGDWTGATLSNGVLKVAFELPAERTGFYHARWVPYTFEQTQDWSNYPGLIIGVETDKPRTDAWVDIALMEEDGSWYYVRDAAPLSAATNQAVVHLADLRLAEFVINAAGTMNGMDGMFDEDFHFDLSKVKRIAVGSVNGFGVGEVSFRVTQLAPASWPEPAQPDSVGVEVTGKLLQVNDTAEIPPGMFGYHIAGGNVSLIKHLRPGSIRQIRAMAPGGAFVTPPDPKNNIDFYVSCQYDRMPNQMLFPMRRGDWQQISQSVGRKLGQMGKPHGSAAVIEWWNEPYLAFGEALEKDPASWLRTDNIREGEPAVTKYGRVLKSFVWMDATDQRTIPRPWHTSPGKPLPAFDGLSKEGKPMKLVARDPSRYDYFAGRQIAYFYIDTFNAMAAEAKKIAPDITLVGGYGFRWHEDEWGSWELLMKPLIDASHQYLDGVCEHHYHCDVTQMPGAYEVLQAYTDTKYGKRIKSYNTETNNLWDTPAMGSPAYDEQKGDTYRSRRRMVYQVRDILYTLQMTPDKVAARAIHALWKQGDGKAPRPGDDGVMNGENGVGIDAGEYLAMYLMRDLRGQLVKTTSARDDVWVVSSIDPETKSLVTLIYNDGPGEVVVVPRITAPDGTRFTEGTVEYIESGDDGSVRLVATGTIGIGTEATAASRRTLRFSMPPNSARRVSMKLAGEWEDKPQVVERQYFCDGILQKLEPGKEVSLPVSLPEDAANADRAWLRLVLERCGDGEGYVRIGDRTIAIPAAYTPAMVPAIREIPIEPAMLKSLKRITFGAAGPEVGNGYLLCAASVYTEKN